MKKRILIGFFGVVMMLFGFMAGRYSMLQTKPVEPPAPPPVVVAPPPPVPVAPAPKKELLPAPKFSKKMPSVFESTKGGINVAWVPVPGAVKYRVTVYDPAGNSVRTFTTPKPSLTITEIPLPQSGETTYAMKMATIDKDGDVGPESAGRRLIMRAVEPERAPARAPIIKSIQIED